MKLFRFASLLASVNVGLFIRPVLSEVTAASLFQTIPSPKDGNCDGSDIDLMVQEAITLNTKAIDALNTLTQDKRLSLFGEEGRLGQIAAAMWGVFRSPDFGLTGVGYFFSDEDKAILNQAKGFYQEVNDKLYSNSRDDGGKLSCGAKDWMYASSWRNLGYHDMPWPLMDGGAFVSKYFSQKDAQGRYPMSKETVMTPATINGENYADTGLCGGRNQALTLPQAKLITMCDSSFGQSTLADELTAQDSWTSGKSIDDLNTVGADFQHEMFHYINKGIRDKQIGKKPAYGWANCALLADNLDKSDNAPQTHNADNYRLFALAAFFNRVNWNAKGQKP